MTVKVETCPDCEQKVAIPDNNVRLDYPAEPYSDDPLGACWRIMDLGAMHMAAAGGEPGEIGHRLHEHQPPEVD